MEPTPTRPYLIRAMHEWCTDNGLTPYLSVLVDEGVQVPREYVREGQIVLNVSFDATSSLQLANDYISFKARFGGVPRDIIVPIERVMAIYARENGQGMSFPVTPGGDDAPFDLNEMDDQPLAGDDGEIPPPAAPVSLFRDTSPADGPQPPEGPAPAPTKGKRPALKRVK